MKYCYFGPHPWEQDGGAVVNYYLLKKQHLLRSTDEYWGIPKIYDQLDASQLPWVNYPLIKRVEDIPTILYNNQIPLLNLFHIVDTVFDNLIDSVHDTGAKIVLHQTIHWPDDGVFNSEKLVDMDKIVAPTEYAKKVFQTVGKIPPEKIEVIPHGVDTESYQRRETSLRSQLGIKPHQKVILYSGRLNFWKGVQEIIPIIRRLATDFDCVFIIRGGSVGGHKEGEALSYIFERISTNNQQVIFLPHWQSPEFMEELYSMGIDILLSNSGHEGFNVPLIEAQAVGAVPVTTALENHVEILGASGHIGILLDPRRKIGEVNKGTPIMIATADQLYGAVKWLLENPDEAEVMGRRGRENVLARFDLAKVAGQWLNLYDELVPKSYSMDEVMKERILNG